MPVDYGTLLDEDVLAFIAKTAQTYPDDAVDLTIAQQRDDVLFYGKIRCDGPAQQGDPTCAPLQDSDFTGLPPTVIFTADCDPLRDDGLAYQARLTAAGVPVHWTKRQVWSTATCGPEPRPRAAPPVLSGSP